MKYEAVTTMSGQTPHVRVQCPEIPAARVYAKLEGCNPTGSIKDRACLGLIRSLREEGKLKPSMTLLDASSGNFACAVAFYGRLMGFPSTVVVNSKLTVDKRNFLEYFGAEIIQVGDFTIEGNRYCREVLLPQQPDKYLFLDQLHNWANPRAYYESLGPEILADFPDVKAVVGSLGSGGTMAGTGKYFREHKPDVKLIAVQAAPGTKLPGTGAFEDGDYITPFIQQSIDNNVFDYVVKVTERDAIQRAMQLKDQGLFCGLQTGGVMQAAVLATKHFHLEGDVVIISGDTGWKNLAKLLQVNQ
jgi:[CysO sulfur-carrier protein]-thiocarboxylate-dependent cysteine synthase